MTDPHFENLLNQADIAARQGNWQEAAHYLAEAVELQPDHVGAITGMGTCALQQNELSDAVQYFEHVTALEPSSPEAHNNLGVAYAMMGEWAAAERSYLQALDLDPEHFQALKNLAQVCLQQNDRLTEGVTILGELYKSNSLDADVNFMLASCYEDAEDWDSAYEMYTQTLDVQPDYPLAKSGFERVSAKRSSIRIAKPEHANTLAQLKSLQNNRNG